MTRLFNILDGIISDRENADANLADLDAIISYAEACAASITEDEATRIQTAGQKWRDEQQNGDGEWGRMRHEAAAALNELSDE